MAKVKIKDQDRRPEISIVVVVGAAALTWLTWILWSNEVPARAIQRDLAEVQVPYRCDVGHEFQDFLNVMSLACHEKNCLSRAWPIWTYECSKDGLMEMQLRYVRKHHQCKIQAARFLGSQWHEVQEDVLCPKCNRTLTPYHVYKSLMANRILDEPARVPVTSQPQE